MVVAICLGQIHFKYNVKGSSPFNRNKYKTSLSQLLNLY